MEKQKEIWKPVRGKEEWAEISNLGQIHYYATGRGRYPDERWTYGSERADGYLNAEIGGVVKGVHVWVYMTFNECDVPKGYDVNHLDENHKNNRLDNLNLLSHGDNMRYGTGIARRSAARRGKKRPAEAVAKSAAANSKPIQGLDKATGEVVFTFPSAAEAERQYGFCAVAISACCRNCYSTHKGNVYKGLIWRYKNFKKF